MPISLIYQILKILAPIVLFAGVLFTAYHKGEQHIQQQWDKRELELTNASVEVLYQAKQHELTVANELTTVKQQITEVSNENKKTITDLTNNNRKLLADRVRGSIQTDCGSNRVSEVIRISSGNDGTGTIARWWLSEAAGNTIISDYEYADKLNESLRACRIYITKLKEVLE